MNQPRRPVRVTDSFFEQLDRLLPADRGPNGEPSATDFLVIDLPPIVDQFATGFDDLPEVIEGVPGLGAGAVASRRSMPPTSNAIEVRGISHRKPMAPAPNLRVISPAAMTG